MLSEKIGHPLPFLLKCLSVRTALSIQAHPDSELAKVLRAANPSAYPDDQAKPEMALAIGGKFEALVGFRPMHEVLDFIQRIPVFAEDVLGIHSTFLMEIIGATLSKQLLCDGGRDNPKPLYRLIVERIMGLSMAALNHSLDGLMKFFTTQRDMSPPKEVFFKLSREFPGDIGILFAFVLNHVVLDEGQCIFLGANEPHAYLSGSCIELMTCSDNVVRAGLTPKFKDVSTLINMLTYESSSPQRFYVPKSPSPQIPAVILYRPPIDAFALEEFSLIASESLEYTFSTESLLLVTEGQGMLVGANGEKHHLSTGSSFYLFPGTQLVIQNDQVHQLKIFRAFKPE